MDLKTRRNQRAQAWVSVYLGVFGTSRTDDSVDEQ